MNLSTISSQFVESARVNWAVCYVVFLRRDAGYADTSQNRFLGIGRHPLNGWPEHRGTDVVDLGGQ